MPPKIGPLAMSVTHANGRVTRWGPDEPNATEIPDNLTFSTSIPGGFKDLQCSLLRRIDISYSDEALFDTVRVYGPGNQTVWEGRVAQLPRSHGDNHSVTPGAVGWAAHLRDDPSFREVYVDIDMTAWQDASLDRRRANAAIPAGQGKIPVSIGVGGIIWTPPNEALPSGELCEIEYDAGPGVKVSAIAYVGQRTGTFTSFETPTVFSGAASSGPFGGSEVITLDGARRTATAFTHNRWLLLRLKTTAGVTPPIGLEQSFSEFAVYGNHGLTPIAITGHTHGLQGSDIITHIVTNAAPMLSTAGISTTAFVIPHAVFRDPVTAEDAISLINGYYAWDWGVWEDKTFFFTQPDPTRLCWEARLSDGARLDLEGDTAEQIFNGVVVSYQDGAGRQMTVGPPGATTDNTDVALQDTSSTNPVNAAGIPRRWEILSLSEPTSLQGATTLGVVWLAQHSLPQRRGSLTLTSTVTHPTKGLQPVCMVRAGDYIKIADHSSSVARKIIETNYSHGSQTITLTLDNTAPKLEALLERLGVGRIGKF